jgi:riboflavin synthase
MFTGLIETIGKITRVTPLGNYMRLTIVPHDTFVDISNGESMAVSGPCLTVVQHDNTSFTVEVSQETLRLTTLKSARPGQVVNLERAVKADSRLGGHFVNGHIDAMIEIRDVTMIGRSRQLTMALPSQYAPLVVDKGSVALDGVSLTISAVGADRFSVNLIPETRKRTALEDIRPGDLVNVEFDIVGKYVLRFLETGKRPSSLTVESLRRMGY